MLTVIILTLNEEIHISRVIQNVRGWATAIFVLDSGSSDRTCEIATSLGATVFVRPFDNYGNQRNYAITELPIQTEWVLFVDADEYLLPELKAEIQQELQHPVHDGYFIKYRMIFMSKWIKYGGYYPVWIMRLFRHSKGRCIRDMNEHIVIDGTVGYLANDFVNEGLKGVQDWVAKHVRYAKYEAAQLYICMEAPAPDGFARLWGGTQAQRKRWVRERVWNRMLPPLLRSFCYFIYRYVLRLGFLDGWQGFIYHFLHGCWYPFLIDVLFLEQRSSKNNKGNASQ
jgi:glycosyltransferase involved in cell wall biosynthesis